MFIKGEVSCFSGVMLVLRMGAEASSLRASVGPCGSRPWRHTPGRLNLVRPSRNASPLTLEATTVQRRLFT